MNDTAKATVLAICVNTLAACASGPEIGSQYSPHFCTHDDDSELSRADWILSEAPPNADSYRASAVESRLEERGASQIDDEILSGTYQDETWLALETGERILCLTDGPPHEAWGAQFWIFSNSGPEVVDSGVWITVG